MKTYRSIGLRLTPQRLAVLKYLEGNKEHPSVEKIYKAVSKKNPTISLATVYSTLLALKNKEYVRELTIDAEKKRYDPNTEPHHHLICISCKTILDIQKEYSLELPEEVKENYTITGNHIEFYGICPACKKKI